MRCISSNDAEELLRDHKAVVNTNTALRRSALNFIDAPQARVGGRPPPSARALISFLEAVNRWLPTDGDRLLWVAHCNDLFPSTYSFFMAARRGVGETRSVLDAPGHLFDAFPFHERDQTEISATQGSETGLLIGFMSTLLLNGWDGWLVSSIGKERIEFWEGNIFFYSKAGERLTNAKELMTEFGCSLKPA